MGEKLTLIDYLNRPITELHDHSNFNPLFFRVATILSQAPMERIVNEIDQQWLNTLTK